MTAINGTEGRDTFEFNSSQDTYTGGSGADTYVTGPLWFSDTKTGALFDGDTITDFSLEDRFNFSGLTYFTVGNFNGIAGEIRYEKVGKQTIIQGDGNGDGVADATLTLTNGAFDLLFAGSSGYAIAGTPTNGSDAVVGTVEADVISSLGGNDLVEGRGGDDEIRGGADNDALFGEFNLYSDDAGNDEIYGEGGNDLIVGGKGNDALYGGAGDDTLIGGVAVAGSYDASASRWLWDWDRREGGNDSFDGGAGIDRAVLTFDRAAAITVDISDPNAASKILADGVAIGSITNVEYILFSGGWGNDVVTGGDFNDGFYGNGGDDVLDGGVGSDWAYYFGAPSAVVVDLRISGPQDTGGAGRDTLISIENLYGYTFDDVFIGNDQVNTLEGWSGNDVLEGGGGDDFLYGGEGADTAVFSGSKGQYSILTDGDGEFVVVDTRQGSPDGSDRLYGVEKLRFADGEFEFDNISVIDAGANYPPVIIAGAGGDSYTLSMNDGTTAVLTLSALDIDAEADDLAFSIVGGADAALFAIDTKSGALNFKVAPDFAAPADAGADNVYDVVIKVTDSKGGSDTGQIAVTVTDGNRPPAVAPTQAVKGIKDVAVLVTVEATDPDGDVLGYTLGNASHGTVVAGKDGTFLYTPDTGFVGADSFTVTVDDGSDGETVQTVNVLLAEQPSAGDWRAFLASGFGGELGGAGTIYGATGLQDVTVADIAGRIIFDPSFNQGGDIIRLSGNAAEWQIVRSGSAALLTDGDTFVQIPMGSTGMVIVFDDGARTLKVQAGSFQIGDQTFAAVLETITSATDGTPLPGGLDADAQGRLFLAPGTSVLAGGKIDIYGTASAETVSVLSGTITLDPSFNKGGDTIMLPLAASDFTANRIGSSVFLDSATTDIRIPIGTAETTLVFAGNDERSLIYDSVAASVRISDQLIGSAPVALSDFA